VSYGRVVCVCVCVCVEKASLAVGTASVVEVVTAATECSQSTILVTSSLSISLAYTYHAKRLALKNNVSEILCVGWDTGKRQPNSITHSLSQSIMSAFERTLKQHLVSQSRVSQ